MVVTPGSLILRFDDVSPWMAWDKFLPLKEKLSALGIRCVLGVVPDCRDPDLRAGQHRADFFSLVRGWAAHGDAIAQHGTHHVYDSQDAGLLGIQKRSEFAGHSYDKQYERLAKGRAILVAQGVWQPYFMAPSHSFDRETLRALRALGFVAVTDGFGFHPYEVDGIVLVPQLTGRPLPIRLGVQTVCIHVNSLPEQAISRLLAYVERHAARFCDFKAASASVEESRFGASILRRGTALGLRAMRTMRAASDGFKLT